MRLRVSVLIFSCAPFFSAAARADSPTDDDHVLPCRPTIACTAEITPPGTFEIEAGVLARKLPNPSRQFATPFLLKLSLEKWVQLQLGDNGYTHGTGNARASYFDNLQAGPKFHLADQDGILPSIAFSAEIGVPTLAGQTGYTRAYDAFLLGYATKDFGPIHADFNVGFNVYGFDGSPKNQEFVALALSMNLPPPFGIMAEGYDFTPAGALSPHDAGFLFAMTVSPKPWLMFDLGGDAGLVPSTRTYATFVGLTVIPAVINRRHKR
ncbi:MAG: transporter, partial [Polyangiaceae bacterium]